MKWKSVLSKEFNHRSQCGMGRLVINCLAQLSDLEPLRKFSILLFFSYLKFIHSFY